MRSRMILFSVLFCLCNLHIRPSSGLPARKLGNAALLPRIFPIEHPELLDEAMIEILKLPDDMPEQQPSPEFAEAEAIYQEQIMSEKVKAYQQYLARKRLVMDYAWQVRYMQSPEWLEIRRGHLKRVHTGQLSRGIVISVGGSLLLNSILTSIKTMREMLGCKLPIEVVYNGPEEMDALTHARFEAFQDVRCIDSSKVSQPKYGRQVDWTDHKDGLRRNMAAEYLQKVFALCHVTSFDEVLLLDGDNLPLVNPETLFDSAGYKKHGNMFWPDYWDANLGHQLGWLEASAYTLFGLEPPWQDDPSGFAIAETGQILINRLWHSDVLDWVWFLNTHYEVMYSTFQGDTETFRLAFHLAGRPSSYEQITTRPAAALDQRLVKRSDDAHQATGQSARKRHLYLFAGMLQHSEEGRPVLMHRTRRTGLLPSQYALWQRESTPDFRRFKFLSVPLSVQRAIMLLGAATGIPDTQVDLTRFEDCPAASLQGFMHECGVNTASTKLPFEILPLKAFPQLAQVATSYEQWVSDQEG